jgi:hypothetical protein
MSARAERTFSKASGSSPDPHFDGGLPAQGISWFVGSVKRQHASGDFIDRSSVQRKKE